MQKYVLVEKDNVVSALSIVGNAEIGYHVSSYCGRSETSRSNVYETGWQAWKVFEDALNKTVEENGWRVIYYGAPKFDF